MAQAAKNQETTAEPNNEGDANDAAEPADEEMGAWDGEWDQKAWDEWEAD